MQSNELTFNQLSVSDFVPNIWGSIDINAYTLYADDEEVCFKLAVWSLQCKFTTQVNSYVNHLIYGIPQPCKLEDLTEFKYGLEVLNNYNPRDIEGNTTTYNTITYSTILKILQTLNNKY